MMRHNVIFHLATGNKLEVTIEKESLDETFEYLTKTPWQGFRNPDGSGLAINMRHVLYAEIKEV